MPSFQAPEELLRLLATRPARLDLTGTDLSSPPLLKLLVDDMRTNTTCLDLALNSCNLGKDIGHLTNAMLQNQGLRLRTLLLKGNNIGGMRQCVHLARLAGASPTLLHLDLASNKLAEDNHGLSSLFAALTTKPSPLLFLDLSANDLNVFDVPQVEALLKARPQLFLNVHGNEVTRRPEMRPALQMLNARHRSTTEQLAQLVQAPTATNRSRSVDPVPPIAESIPDKVVQNTPAGMAPPAPAAPAAPAAPSAGGTTKGKPCANCQQPVVDFQYRCCTCPGFRYCVPCYEKHLRRPMHDADHSFVGFDVPVPAAPAAELPPKVETCSACSAPQADCKCHVAASSNETALPPRSPTRTEPVRSATPQGAPPPIADPAPPPPPPLVVQSSGVADHDLSTGDDDDDVDESTPIASPRAAAAKRSSLHAAGRSSAVRAPRPEPSRPPPPKAAEPAEEGDREEDGAEDEAEEDRPEEVRTVEAEDAAPSRSQRSATPPINDSEVARQLAAATVVSHRASSVDDASQRGPEADAKPPPPGQPARRPYDAGHLKNALSSQILAQLHNLGLGSDDEGSEEAAPARPTRPATARERLESHRPRPAAPAAAADTPARVAATPAKAGGQCRRGKPQKWPPSPPAHQSAPVSPHGPQDFLPDRDERPLFVPTATSAPRIPLTYLARPPTDIAAVVSERVKRAAKGKIGPPARRDTFAAIVPPAALANGRVGPGAYAKDTTKTPFVPPSAGQRRPPTGFNTRGRPIWHM